MNHIEILQAARAKVAAGHTKGAYARRAGQNLRFDDERATCYCAVGAIAAVCGSLATADYIAAIYLGPHLPANKLIRDWNDHPDRTVDEVLALFDAVILNAAVPPANQAVSDVAKGGNEP